MSEGLEAPVQLLYLLTLLGFLAAGAYLVVRQVLTDQRSASKEWCMLRSHYAAARLPRIQQPATMPAAYGVPPFASNALRTWGTTVQCLVSRQVLIRRELEEAAKVLGERIRTGDASAEVLLGRAPSADSCLLPYTFVTFLCYNRCPLHRISAEGCPEC